MYYKLLLQQNTCKPNGYLISVAANVLACLDATKTVDGYKQYVLLLMIQTQSVSIKTKNLQPDTCLVLSTNARFKQCA